MSQGKRKFESIDPVKLRLGMSKSRWKLLLTDIMKRQDVHKLIKWRYGLQAGLADANRNSKVTTQEIDVWVIARIKDLENAMKYIVRDRHPNPLDNPLNLDVHDKAYDAKRKRDSEYQNFLMRSNF